MADVAGAKSDWQNAGNMGIAQAYKLIANYCN